MPGFTDGGWNFMSDLAKTVLPAVNKLIDLGIADQERLGAIGVSYGGYHLLSLMVQTTRFKAAIMIAGFGDLVSFSGEMDKEGVTLGELIQEPWSPWEECPENRGISPTIHSELSRVLSRFEMQTPLSDYSRCQRQKCGPPFLPIRCLSSYGVWANLRSTPSMRTKAM